MQTELATQACALTGNRTGDPLVRARAQSTELHQSGLFRCILEFEKIQVACDTVIYIIINTYLVFIYLPF